MASQNLTSVAALQAYVQDYANTLIQKMFFGFKTGGIIMPHEGVKGKKTLTQLTLDALSKRYSKTFAPTADAIGYLPRTLEVHDAKVDLQVTPKDIEETYAGIMRRKGQDPRDWPFEAEILDSIISKVASEHEVAIWKGVAAVSPASTDLLAALFDGLHQIIADEITATNLTPTTTGALTSTNAVASVEDVLESMGSQYLDTELDCFMSPFGRIKFIQDYRTRYGSTSFSFDGGALKSDIGNLKIHACPGVKASAITITPAENLHYGYDGAMDSSLINFEQEDRSIKLWMDYKLGTNVGIVDDEIIGVNDQH